MSQFTKLAIVQTFQEMLYTTSFDKITVTQLIRECGIASNTFYYHFRDIYDLLDFWLKRSLRPLLEAHAGDLREPMKAMLYKAKANPQLVYHITDSLSREQLEYVLFTYSKSLLERYVREWAEGYDVSDERLTELADFCRFSLLGFLMQFIIRNMDEDIEKTVNQLDDTFVLFLTAAIGPKKT